MATKAYLSPEQFNEGKALFLSKDLRAQNLISNSQVCSDWLSETLTRRVSELPGWSQIKPIKLGSWARGELAPKSDVDLLFLGPEEMVAQFMRAAMVEGLKIRGRVPQDRTNWTVGVEPFDILALSEAKAFDVETEMLLHTQQPHIRKHLKSIVTAVRRDRLERKKRYDSITNYLEPQLKAGEGGLRDLGQALSLAHFFAPDAQVLAKIREAKNYLTGLRQLVHWLGGTDILAAPYQIELAQILKFSDLSALMREVHIRLERGSFYADWLVKSLGSDEKVKVVSNAKDAIKLLSKDPGIKSQYRVRTQSKSIWKNSGLTERGRTLKTMFSKAHDDEFWIAIARSLFLEEALPDLKLVKGLTQHDHYHRYTVESHLYKTIREVDRACKSSRQLFALARISKSLSKKDWEILRWTALFHDLGKGRKRDHSQEGSLLVRTWFKKWGLPKELTLEVAWMVESHLLMTAAALRQNVSLPSTWKRLFDLGVRDNRIRRLAVFSAIDIRATNPEAWTSWKAELLKDLVDKLESPEAVSQQKLEQFVNKNNLTIPIEISNALDPFLVENVRVSSLAKDLQDVLKSSQDLEILVVPYRKKQHWVRFHSLRDRPGLFLDFVARLYLAGARIDSAFVRTFETKGAYDWFLVRSNKSSLELYKRLKSDRPITPQVPSVRFQAVNMVSESDREWVLSFRGRDQKGLLLAAAKALYDLGLAIRSASVHTWGNQIDDVFYVEAKGDLSNHLTHLRKIFVT